MTERPTTPIRNIDGPDAIPTASTVIDAGGLVIYPTETLYGLGADATEPHAIEAVFDAKARDRSSPISLAVHSLDAADRYVRPTPRERAFMESFLPGPVTVVCEKRSAVPDVLTAGKPKVGLRIPDHDAARRLLERCGPLTATSANRSGTPGSRRVSELDTGIVEAAGIVLDGGTTPGGASTVVDVEEARIIRDGENVDEIRAWLRH